MVSFILDMLTSVFKDHFLLLTWYDTINTPPSAKCFHRFISLGAEKRFLILGEQAWLPLFPPVYLHLEYLFMPWFCLFSLGTVCKTMCGVAAGCTKNSITAHFAVAGNIADVSAKESAQETAVTLCGIMGGLAFASTIADPRVAWHVFIALTLLHVVANYRGKSILPSIIHCFTPDSLLYSITDRVNRCVSSKAAYP